ncbi:hypothetical protein [Flavisolibacter tropicus]|uniref:hypothetical protein n=1 Tax=Flavisolibacter tropicus TaxID=1492898 RepID=UPI0008378920|nr:hypothetical protein [Flavisolibacter tropicus]
MATILKLTITLSITLLLSCNSQSNDTTNSSKKDTVISNIKKAAFVDSPRSFIKNYGAGNSNRLFAFVGERVSVEPLPHEQGSMDNGFKGKYAILQKVYGDFPEDTIEFVAYDHYGKPPFSKYKNVLLYVSADSGTYYHQKYQYNDVYKTKDGRWAGTYTADDYEHPYNKHTEIKPVKIKFVAKVTFPTKTVDDEGRQLEYLFPKPYFKTEGDSAIAIYGNYVEDLFALKKSGVLTARGLFVPTAEQEEDMVESGQPEAPKTPPSADDLKFLAFWKTFVAAVKEPGMKNFKNIALDTLYVCDQLLPVGKFIDKCFGEVIDDEVQKRIVDRTKLEYTSSEVEFYNLLTSQVKKEIKKVGSGYRLRKMVVTRSTKNNNPPKIYFGFIETKKGYRLYEIDHYWFKQCCQ